MVEWHHQLNGHEFEQTLGDGEGQGGLACFSSWGHKESDTTELNCTFRHQCIYIKMATQKPNNFDKFLKNAH